MDCAVHDDSNIWRISIIPCINNPTSSFLKETTNGRAQSLHFFDTIVYIKYTHTAYIRRLLSDSFFFLFLFVLVTVFVLFHPRKNLPSFYSIFKIFCLLLLPFTFRSRSNTMLIRQAGSARPPYVAGRRAAPVVPTGVRLPGLPPPSVSAKHRFAVSLTAC